ncbi:torsin-1A-like isoform X2 [Liolophura sinensis]|uniref:torsin-1A-like isoform X2 n=1 Tax=Liolophura sinensis TaxID=3198878 RepID=UPI0031583139
MNSRLTLTCLFLGISFHISSCFDPISLGAGAAIGVGSAVIGGWTFVQCRIFECCNSRWVNTNMTGLASRLESQLYGQHLAVSTIAKHISAHMRNPNPTKALGLSFQGWTGTGKNYASQILAKHIYRNGMRSKYVHLISATREFPHADKVQQYKENLKQWIEGNITKCERSLFIFDEMDKLPNGLLDVIKPYLEYYEDISGVVYRKAIFIFLSNTAGQDISQIALKHFHSAQAREDLQLKDLEKEITRATVNTQKGLWHSELVTKNLITAYIPFLPLERSHVKECIVDVLVDKGYLKSRKERKEKADLLNTIADELIYYPNDEKIYSTTGCKRVAEKVDFVLEDI